MEENELDEDTNKNTSKTPSPSLPSNMPAEPHPLYVQNSPCFYQKIGKTPRNSYQRKESPNIPCQRKESPNIPYQREKSSPNSSHNPNQRGESPPDLTQNPHQRVKNSPIAYQRDGSPPNESQNDQSPSPIYKKERSPGFYSHRASPLHRSYEQDKKTSKFYHPRSESPNNFTSQNKIPYATRTLKKEALNLSRSPLNIDVSESSKIFSENFEERQAYSLSWKEFSLNFIDFFRELKEQEELVDVTLACEGQQVFAHKAVLAASSPFFRSLLKNNPCQHPIIILNDVRYSELCPLLHYMYHGQVNVHSADISSFLKTARLLQIRGLTDSSGSQPDSREKFNENSFTGIETGEETGVETGSKRPKLNILDLSNERCNDRSQSPISKRIKRAENFSDQRTSPNENSERISPAKNIPMIGQQHQSSFNCLPTLIPMPNVPGEFFSANLSHPPRSLSNPPHSPHLKIATHPLQSIPSLLQKLGPHPPNFGQEIYNSEEMSDAGGSEKSEDKTEDDYENSLEKMSGMANMASLKGLQNFPGTSSLLGMNQGHNITTNPEISPGRSRYDLYKVRATDPRPCHICGKIYKNAHTLRTHMEDKHSNCNGFRCVLCGTVAKSRNSLHSHMSRQHRGISTKDLPLLPMPSPWNPEIASKYIQIVGGVGEVVRQNYRRADKEEECSNLKDPSEEGAQAESDTSTPNPPENGPLSPTQNFENDKDRRAYEEMLRQIELNNYRPNLPQLPTPNLPISTPNLPPSATLLDTYLHMMRVSGVDLMQGMQEKLWQDLRQNTLENRNSRENASLARNSPLDFPEKEAKKSHFLDNGYASHGKEQCLNEGFPPKESTSPKLTSEDKWRVK